MIDRQIGDRETEEASEKINKKVVAIVVDSEELGNWDERKQVEEKIFTIYLCKMVYF